jgi:P pilus assembly chaperone PapD
MKIDLETKKEMISTFIKSDEELFMNVKRMTTMTCIGFMAFWIGSNTLLAGVSISPAFVQVSLDKKRPAGQFIITNTGTETERYRIATSHFIFGDNGELNKKNPDENSLASWIKFNPKEFSLPPKTKRSIRFVIVPPGKIDSKEYWGFMELQSLKTNITSTEDKKGRTMKLTVIPTIIVPIFATKGEISYSATLGETRVVDTEKGLEINTMVKNTGKGHLVLIGNFEMIDSSGGMIKKGGMGKNYILPGGQRKFKGIVNTEISKGDFTVNVAYSSSKLKGILTDNIQHSR